MSILDLIPPTGCNLTYLVQLADRWPSDLRRELDDLHRQGRVERLPVDGVVFWRPVRQAPAQAEPVAVPTPAPAPTPTIEALICEAADAAGVAPGSIARTKRTLGGAAHRDAAAWLLRERRGMSYPEIAKALGYRSHTSVMVAVKRHQERTSKEVNHGR